MEPFVPTTPEQVQDLENELRLLADEVISLVMRKRGDYGTANINQTGRYGVAVRLLDKVSRLLNLTDKSHKKAPSHETVSDTWTDIIGYGLIGLYMEKNGGKW